MNARTDFKCPCCGHDDFLLVKALWPDLIKQWGLTKEETRLVNRQQGLHCKKCVSNLRSMTLAKAIMISQEDHTSTLVEFLKQNPNLKILEVNEAGHLAKYFKDMPGHTIGEYPEVDIHDMPYADNEFDLVIHSDTLEHVKDPVKAISETLRVLKPGGFTCYTVPSVVSRQSKLRPKNKPSYHGSEGNDEYLVYTEYGSDAWTQPLEAGFADVRLCALEYKSSVAIIAQKQPDLKRGSSFLNKLIRAKR